LSQGRRRFTIGGFRGKSALGAVAIGERLVQINISTRHGHLSQVSQDRISEKVAKLNRLFERLTAVAVVCDVGDEASPQVEIKVSAERAGEFVATEQAETLMAAVDGAMHKLEQQLRKHKEKIKGHRTPGHRHEELAEEPTVETEE
jgi:putative sigma-54 modulation protein